MIRLLLLTSAFLTVTAVLLLMQPGPVDETTGADDVTRASADPLDLAREVQVETRPRARPSAEDTGAKPLAALSQEAIRALRANPSAQGPVLLPGELRAQIIQAIGEGRDDAYIQALLEQAIAMGESDVPTALITRQGRLDSHAILEQLERRDQSRTVLLGRDEDRALRPETYTVEPGDSLAAIARKFYGRTDAFDEIYEANRDRLSAPDAIRPGQLIILPDL